MEASVPKMRFSRELFFEMTGASSLIPTPLKPQVFQDSTLFLFLFLKGHILYIRGQLQ